MPAHVWLFDRYPTYSFYQFDRRAVIALYSNTSAKKELPAFEITADCFFFSSRRRHTRFDCDWQTCALPISVARAESKRGTTDPTYGYYTMGKLAILKLRDDYRAKKGAAFTLQEFHDSFIRLGPLPLPLIRN